jgi:hypothetical protein
MTPPDDLMGGQTRRQANPAEPRVDELLARVRAGVRQRQAELATLAGGEELKLLLLELKTLEYVEEPVAYSPRPLVGRLLVFVRKAMFHLFFKWYARPVRERQNRFNQVASQLLHEMAAREARLAGALERALAEMQALQQTAERPAEAAERPAGGAESRCTESRSTENRSTENEAR